MDKNTLIKQLQQLRLQFEIEIPDNAEELVLEGLSIQDPEVLKFALDAVSTVEMNDNIARELLRILVLSDNDDLLRGRAAIALGPALEDFDMTMGECDDDFNAPFLSKGCYEEITTVFKQIFESENSSVLVKRRTLEASVRSSQPWHKKAVKQAFESKDTDWRVTAVFCMLYVPGFGDEIVASLNDKSSEVQFQAVMASSELELTQAGNCIMEFAKSSETEHDLRLASIDALAFVRPFGTFDLLEELCEHSNKEIADLAEEALEELMLQESFDDLMDQELYL